jgi:nitrite reductase/ring-hydroxylating ferredoxin subunit
MTLGGPALFHTSRNQKRRSRATAVALALVAFVAGAVPVQAALSTKAQPTWQANATVYAIVRSGGTIYLGGAFTQVMSHDGQIVARNHLAAFDAQTGEVTAWNPGAGNTVRALALSADGGTVYAGGSFGTVGGKTRTRLAAINATTGSVLDTWKPRASATVRALGVSAGRVYLGGTFLSVNGSARLRLAAVDAAMGTLVSGWAPRADAGVRALLVSPDGTRVFVGGGFVNISGSSQSHLAALSAGDGSVSAWLSHPSYPVNALAQTNSMLYGGGSGGGGSVPAFDITTGALKWTGRTDGDVAAVAVFDGQVIAGGHFRYYENQFRGHIAAVDAVTGALDANWHPRLNGTVGVTAEFAASDHVYVGGTFTTVAGIAQARFASFARK